MILSKSAFLAIPKLQLNGPCYIGPDGSWDAKGGIIVGSNVIIGPSITVLSSSHNYKSTEMLPYDGTKDILGTVVIQDNVWIGSNVLIVPGVTIGEGAVVGAGSVVTKNVPPGGVVAGNPAKLINQRDMKQYEKMKQEKKFYLARKFGLDE